MGNPPAARPRILPDIPDSDPRPRRPIRSAGSRLPHRGRSRRTIGRSDRLSSRRREDDFMSTIEPLWRWDARRTATWSPVGDNRTSSVTGDVLSNSDEPAAPPAEWVAALVYAASCRVDHKGKPKGRLDADRFSEDDFAERSFGTARKPDHSLATATSCAPRFPWSRPSIEIRRLEPVDESGPTDCKSS